MGAGGFLSADGRLLASVREACHQLPSGTVGRGSGAVLPLVPCAAGGVRDGFVRHAAAGEIPGETEALRVGKGGGNRGFRCRGSGEAAGRCPLVYGCDRCAAAVCCVIEPVWRSLVIFGEV